MTSETFDYYRELEVDPAACPEVIRAAYSALVRIHHTDTNPAADGERIKRITVAYGCLRDPDTRAEYDAEIAVGQRRRSSGQEAGRKQTDREQGRASSGSSSQNSQGGPLRCEKCGRTFKSEKGLKWHRRTSPGARPAPSVSGARLTSRSMEITPGKRKVVGLVEQAYEGKICLPDFQREFVWSREEVADLVRSILRQYFIGSLLLLQSDPANPPFAPVFLRGAQANDRNPRPDYLILDGQQRLSALIYALTAPDLSLKDSSQRRWFFVDLDVLLSDPESDEIVFDRTQRDLRGLETHEVQFRERRLPCTALLDQDRFFKWRDSYEEWLDANAPELVPTYKNEWRSGWTKAATAFQTFQVALIELPRVNDGDGDDIGRVCAIFEKLNSTGVELSVYDLLTARLYRSGIELHRLWNEACADHPRLREWSKGKADEHKFGVLVLRTLALLRGLDAKARILVDLDPSGFEKDWRRAARAIERALEMITLVAPDGFGVFSEKWLPGFGLIPILAALRAEVDDRKLGEQARADIRRWYWCNVFLERYSSGVESKSRKDYLEMTRHWLENGPEPEVFQEAQNLIGTPGFHVRGSASYASAVYSGVFSLLAIRNARDWIRGEDIQLQALQDHHIYPQAFLRRHEITKRVDVNSIANRTLISDETNGRISDKAPAEYLDEIFPPERSRDLLHPHFIDGVALETMEATQEELDNLEVGRLFEQFLAEREALIIEEIRRVCGVRLIEGAPSPMPPEAEQLAEDVRSGESPDGELDLPAWVDG